VDDHEVIDATVGPDIPEFVLDGQWLIVEQMGHRRFAGRCYAVTVAGAAMIRVDVPTGPDAYRTSLLGPRSIFGLHPCTEAVARQLAGSSSLPVGYLDFRRSDDGVDPF
jgi:hypothetical protein